METFNPTFLFLLALPFVVAAASLLSTVKITAAQSKALIATLALVLVAATVTLAYQGMGAEFFDFSAWSQWASGIDRSFLFMMVLPLVVATVGLLSDRRDVQAGSIKDTQNEGVGINSLTTSL